MSFGKLNSLTHYLQFGIDIDSTFSKISSSPMARLSHGLYYPYCRFWRSFDRGLPPPEYSCSHQLPRYGRALCLVYPCGIGLQKCFWKILATVLFPYLEQKCILLSHLLVLCAQSNLFIISFFHLLRRAFLQDFFAQCVSLICYFLISLIC